MHTTNYVETFIEVAEDCPTERAEIPSLRNGERTVALIHYELMINNPYQYTSDDIIFATYAERKSLAESDLDVERRQFFSKGQACLRSSPLTKRYGWGIHCDTEGKVAIYPMESDEYRTFRDSKSLKHLKGMRSKKT